MAVDPGKRDPASVNKGYNEELDLPRPSSMDHWLELSALILNPLHDRHQPLHRKYRVVFVVDDSSAVSALIQTYPLSMLIFSR